MKLATLTCLILCGCLLSNHPRCEAQETPPPGITETLNLTDVHGQVHSLGPTTERTALAIVLLSTECPISNSYIRQLNQLAKSWSNLDSQVKLLGFVADRTLSRQAALKHSEEYELGFPVIFDGSGELAGLLKPTHTPEAFLLNPKGKIVYRGRIDNLYADVGKRRQKPTTHDLQDAVSSLLKGEPVKSAYQKPVGCFYEPEGLADNVGSVTFNRDIAPIIYANCTSCHREGEVAPFPLTTYENVSKRAAQINRVIKSGLMPPWRPEEGVGHFLGERRLTNQQKQLLSRWETTGRQEGDEADRPIVPDYPTGWQLGEPDLILKMPTPFKIAADGPDIFQNFVLPMNLDKDHFVMAAEFKPGNKRVTHHSIFYLDKNGAARKLDEADPQPGYSTFGGPGFIPTGAVGGWSPGTTPRILPGGFCRYAAKGSDLVLQIHYHPTGKEEVDQSEVGLYFSDKPKNIVGNVTLANYNFKIEAGDHDHVVTASYTLPSDVTLVGLTPHMHLVGKSMSIRAKHVDGSTEDLLQINDWHFYWQDQYYLQSSKRLPKGTELLLEAHYDNSEDNPFNPSSPPRIVTFGEETTDEMCFCFCLIATDSPFNLLPVILDNLQEVGRQRREIDTQP